MSTRGSTRRSGSGEGGGEQTARISLGEPSVCLEAPMCRRTGGGCGCMLGPSPSEAPSRGGACWSLR
eukprot:7384366-Prymnesium_polylepis.1